MVYSSSSIWADYKFGDSFHYLKYQGVFFVIGLFIMIFISYINPKVYYKYSNKILIFSFILLVLVLIPGIGSVRNGSRSWFGIAITETIPRIEIVTSNSTNVKPLLFFLRITIITYLIEIFSYFCTIVNCVNRTIIKHICFKRIFLIICRYFFKNNSYRIKFFFVCI